MPCSKNLCADLIFMYSHQFQALPQHIPRFITHHTTQTPQQPGFIRSIVTMELPCIMLTL